MDQIKSTSWFYFSKRLALNNLEDTHFNSLCFKTSVPYSDSFIFPLFLPFLCFPHWSTSLLFYPFFLLIYYHMQSFLPRIFTDPWTTLCLQYSFEFHYSLPWFYSFTLKDKFNFPSEDYVGFKTFLKGDTVNDFKFAYLSRVLDVISLNFLD